MGKHFIDPKSSEILLIFQVFPCTTQIALIWPKLLPALFLRSLDIPALLKSWQKHYLSIVNDNCKLLTFLHQSVLKRLISNCESIRKSEEFSMA
jgi:hypothetical protein